MKCVGASNSWTSCCSTSSEITSIDVGDPDIHAEYVIIITIIMMLMVPHSRNHSSWHKCINNLIYCCIHTRITIVWLICPSFLLWNQFYSVPAWVWIFIIKGKGKDVISDYIFINVVIAPKAVRLYQVI